MEDFTHDGSRHIACIAVLSCGMFGWLSPVVRSYNTWIPNQSYIFKGSGFTKRLGVLSVRKLALCEVMIIRADWPKGKGPLITIWHRLFCE